LASNETVSVTQSYSKLLLLLLLLCCFIALFYAGKWGVAAIGHTFSLWQFNSWQEQGPPDERTWKWVHESMVWSIRLDANNAEYRNDMGRLYEYTATRMTEHPSQMTPLLKISLSYFRDASRLRPAWPLAWVNIALIKDRINIIDSEFFLALDRSLALGPSTPVVQQIIAEVGIYNWHALNIPLRTRVLKNIRDGLVSRNRAQIGRVVDRHGMKQLVCDFRPIPDENTYCKHVVK